MHESAVGSKKIKDEKWLKFQNEKQCYIVSVKLNEPAASKWPIDCKTGNKVKGRFVKMDRQEKQNVFLIISEKA